MKKSVVILLIIMANNLSFSQIQKGNLIIGGSGKFSNVFSKINNNQKSSTFEYSPEINYLVSSNVMVGIGVNFGVTNLEGELLSHLASAQIDHSIILRSKSFGGFLQIKYTNKITQKLNYSIALKGGYGDVTQNISAKNQTNNGFPFPVLDGYPISVIYGMNSNGTIISTEQIKQENINPYHFVTFTPQILYTPFKRLAIQFEMGGLEYLSFTQKTFSSQSTDSDVSLNVKPSNWSLGVFYIFGKQTN